MGRYSGDNETVSVSSASVSRPPTAGKSKLLFKFIFVVVVVY